MGLLDLVRAVKAGTRKLSDVPPGLRRQVKRLVPVVRAEPPTRGRPPATRGIFTPRPRRARST